MNALLELAHESALTRHVVEWAGRPVGSIKRALAAAAARAALKGVTPGVLRHTGAVRMAEAGIPMETIAARLGRDVAAVEHRYARFAPDDLTAAARELE